MPDVIPTYGPNSTSYMNQPGSSSGTGAIGQDQFLQLLVTQLNYQDPLDPMNSQAFAAQLAQFTSVEQLISINSTLRESIQAQMLLNQSINNTLSAQLIGLEVKAENDIVMLEDGEATPIMFNLPSGAESVTITINDSSGNTVWTENLSGQEAGDHTYEWDGRNRQGSVLPEGEYTFTVTAKSAEGNNLKVRQFIQGIITGIEYEGGQAVLKVGNLPVYLPRVYGLNTPEGGG